MKVDISWKQPFCEIQSLLFFFLLYGSFLSKWLPGKPQKSGKTPCRFQDVFHSWVFLISHNHSRSNILHKNFHASTVCAFFTNEEAKDDAKENAEWKVRTVHRDRSFQHQSGGGFLVGNQPFPFLQKQRRFRRLSQGRETLNFHEVKVVEPNQSMLKSC